MLRFNYQACPASKSSFLNVAFIVGDSLAVEKEMVFYVDTFIFNPVICLLN